MVITYALGRGLYVNITNKCDNRCEFCIRRTTDRVGPSEPLWLEREPDGQEILDDILKHDTKDFDELVFCGFGEPTERLGEMLWVCGVLKSQNYPLPIRLNTNGHAPIKYGRSVAVRFHGLFDTISISLNAKNASDYNALCHPLAGEGAYFAMLNFASEVKQYVPHVVLTVVDVMPEADIAECRALADSLGIELRVRKYIKEY